MKRSVSAIVTLSATLLCITSSPSWAQERRSAPNEIHIGGSSALSGALQNIGSAFPKGAQLYFDAVNAAGGVNGRQIKYTVLDDAYVVDRSIANMNRLIEQDEVLSLFGMFGTPNVLATLPIAERQRVPYFAPSTGANQIRDLNAKMLFTTAASYGDEAARMVAYLAQLGVDRTAIVYQNNSTGQTTRKVTVEKLRDSNLPAAKEFAVELNGSNIPDLAKAVAKEDPSAIFLFTFGKLTGDFVKTYAATGQRAQIFVLSIADVAALYKELGLKSRGIIVTQNLPPPWVANTPLVKEYIRLLGDAAKGRPDYIHFWGFVSAKAFVELLRKSGKNLSRDGLIATIKASRPMDLGGYIVDFSGGRQHGAKYVDITMLGADGLFIR
ncbi:MAG: hypothetical protein EAZ30_09660 [Betaproteobacteria bacterium]|nr:MAG: hypothetical protein EAZ30_09660 [Betaproteobacteria bacterium]